MQAHCAQIKNAHKGAYTVFIGPCISKKDEAAQYSGMVDCVLTFEELTQWMQEENVAFDASVPDREQGGKARLFPTSGGILRSMACDSERYSYMVVDGVENCMHALEDIVNGKLSDCFIEMSACAGSCIGGPAMDKPHVEPVRDFVSIDRYAPKTRDFAFTMPQRAQLKKEMSFIGLHHQMPGNKTIEEILRKMGKTKPEDELNCGSCGYNTCREKAVAVYFGKANLTMCHI